MSGLGIEAAAILRAGHWQEGLAAAEEQSALGDDAGLQLLIAIAKVRLGKSDFSPITANLICKVDGRRDLRHLLISPLALEGRYGDAIDLLGRIIEALPPAIEELRLRASYYGRQKNWNAAIADADRLAALCKGDPVAATLQLQYRLQAGRIRDAAELVTSFGKGPRGDNRLDNMVLVVMLRTSEFERAAEYAARIAPDGVRDAALAGNIVQALFRAGRFDQAITTGEWFLAKSLDGPGLRSHLAQAWLRSRKIEQRAIKASEHLARGIEMAPGDVRMLSLLSELNMRSGKTDEAIGHLQRGVEIAPHLSQLRALHARALKQAGRYDEAADQFKRLLDSGAGEVGAWQRHAAGALSQAGRREEAIAVFASYINRRRAALPDTFDKGLNALWDKLDTAAIPQARLDWAWSMRAQDCTLDRTEWERRARWGHLADLLLLDWIECRDDRVEEIMRRFRGLKEVEDFFASLRSKGNAIVLASAHIGPMYAGPLVLELLGEPVRWLASTPGVAQTAYMDSLISTSDQTDTQVGRAFMRALRSGHSVIVAADGAIDLAAPRIAFEGQEITYSNFAVRMAHRMRLPSAFVSPVWDADYQLAFVCVPLPMPEAGENVNTFTGRWERAYFKELRAYLSGRPENLRLAGGIWRHIV